jgi:hypothetical protein
MKKLLLLTFVLFAIVVNGYCYELSAAFGQDTTCTWSQDGSPGWIGDHRTINIYMDVYNLDYQPTIINAQASLDYDYVGTDHLYHSGRTITRTDEPLGGFGSWDTTITKDRIKTVTIYVKRTSYCPQTSCSGRFRAWARADLVW